MAQVHCSRCGDEIEEGTRPCAYCNVPQSRIGDADANLWRHWPLKLAKALLIGIIIPSALVLIYMVLWEGADRSYLVRAKLSKVASALDPIKIAITMTRQEQGRLPLVTTVVTAANQGQAATPDWAALGFDTLPVLTRETRTLRVTPEGDIVVTIANIKEGIDDTELRARALRNESGWSWQYECSSDDSVLKKFFHC